MGELKNWMLQRPVSLKGVLIRVWKYSFIKVLLFGGLESFIPKIIRITFFKKMYKKFFQSDFFLFFELGKFPLEFF